MATGRNLFGIIGAGYTGSVIFNNQELFSELGRNAYKAALSGTGLATSGSGRPSGDYEQLAKLVRELERSVHSIGSRASVTVVQAGGSARSSLPVIGGIITLGAGGLLYLRFRGFSKDDIVYVTRTGFKNGMVAMMGQVGKVKEYLSGRIDALAGRVEEGLVIQDGMATDVADIQASMQRMSGGMGDMRNTLEGVETRLDSINDKQEFACRGIYLLCSVVSEATGKAVDTTALREFTQQQPAIGSGGGFGSLRKAGLSELLTHSRAGYARFNSLPSDAPTGLAALPWQASFRTTRAGSAPVPAASASAPPSAAPASSSASSSEIFASLEEPHRGAAAALQQKGPGVRGGAAAEGAQQQGTVELILATIKATAQQHMSPNAAATKGAAR